MELPISAPPPGGKGQSGSDLGDECWAEGDCLLLWEPGDTPQPEAHQ